MNEPTENRALSEREIEVLRLLAAGLSNKEIAAQLVLSVNTVKVHLRNIFAKLGVQSRTEATLVALQRGWVAMPTLPEAGPAAGEMIYAPAEPPPIIIEPPLPIWQRLAMIGAALTAIAGVVVSGVAAGSPAAAGPNLISDSPNGVRVAQSVTGDSQWRASTQMPTARTRLAVATYGGRLLAIGGDTQNGASTVV